ncbi:MAG TPA: YjbQ family protein, partial [Anaerolineales bacterium]|nr:YjbQ family protein [Anaerolineales bacterium]
MTVVHNSFKIQSDRMPTFHDVTEDVQTLLKKSGITNGLVVVYSQHTTCSVFVQEDADDVNYWGTKLLLQDLVNVFENIVPTCHTEGQYLH